MRRKILILLLAIGTLGGFLMGFASLRCRSHWGQRGAFYGGRFEQRVSEICTASALKVYRGQQAAAEPVSAPEAR